MRMLLICLAACSSESSDTAAPVQGDPSIEITSPAEGAWVDQGQPVTFSVQGRHGDHSHADAESVVWSTDGWSLTGNHMSATDLPAGSLVITVDAVVDDVALQSAVSVSVFSASDDTGS